MAQEEFDFVITPDGEVRMETHGVKGPRCLERLAFFAGLLGEVRSQELTADYYQGEGELCGHGEVEQHIRR